MLATAATLAGACLTAGVDGAAAAASDKLPASNAIDLSAGVQHSLAGFSLRKLPHPDFGGIEGFAFDQTHHYLFVVQNYSYHFTNSKGEPDIMYTDTDTINRVSLQTGKVLDNMTVADAGHGSIGVVPLTNGGTRIWLEGNRSSTTHRSTKEIFGSELDYFNYKPNSAKPGGPLPPAPEGLVRRFRDNPNVKVFSDAVHQRLGVRYYNKTLHKYRVEIYPWDHVNGASVLRRVTLPSLTDAYGNHGSCSSLQDGKCFFTNGFALYGQYLYVLSGRSSTETSIQEVDLNTVVDGAAKQTRAVATHAWARTLSGYKAEPEALAVYKIATGRFGLAVGFTTHVDGTHPEPTTTIVCKVGFAPHSSNNQPSTC